MRIEMREVGNSEILAGALSGRKVLGLLLEQIAKEPEKPETLFLDFRSIEVATASFLRECILVLRDTVRQRKSHFYPVVANANETVLEELMVLLSPQRDVLMLCSIDNNGNVSDSRLVGQLEPKQQITFDLVQELGETDAGKLMLSSPEPEKISQTGWNNRLASLARLGIVVEHSIGRSKRYRPLLEEV